MIFRKELRMKQNKKNSKVIQYRRPIHINIGVIIFLFIFIYLAYSVISYMTSDRIQVYEVGEEVSLSRDQTYTGLILREELVANTDQTGYVNYYMWYILLMKTVSSQSCSRRLDPVRAAAFPEIILLL